MPGDNCAFNGCGTSRRTKGVGIFKVPKDKKWRSEFLNVLTKYREKDDGFKRQLHIDSLHVCEKHFAPDEIIICRFIDNHVEDDLCVKIYSVAQKSLTKAAMIIFYVPCINFLI